LFVVAGYFSDSYIILTGQVRSALVLILNGLQLQPLLPQSKFFVATRTCIAKGQHDLHSG
jgi:hypothetical protein